MSYLELNNMPHTDFGAALTLTQEQERLCRVVYRQSPENMEKYIFDGLWSEEGKYGDDCIVAPLRTTAIRKVWKEAGFSFANLTGSKDDTYNGDKKWMDILRNNGISCQMCATDGYYYNADDDSIFNKRKNGKPVKCDATEGMVSGHVYEGKVNRSFKKRVQATVLMIPICKPHNSCACGTGSGNGTGFYMKLNQGMDILELTGYLNIKDISKYITK